jgi:hypothetical protein
MRSPLLLALPLLLSAAVAIAAPSATMPVAKPVSPGQASANACVDACSDQQDACATTEPMDPGADRVSLCADRFKVCIERCDPHYLNYHKVIDEHPVKTDATPIPKMTPAQQCAAGCGAKAQTCSDAGNSAKVCDTSRAACLQSCGSPGSR